MDVERNLGVGGAGMSLGDDEELVNMAQAITSAVSRHIPPENPVHEIENLNGHVLHLLRQSQEQLRINHDQIAAGAAAVAKNRKILQLKVDVMKEMGGAALERRALYLDENPYEITSPKNAQPFDEELRKRVAELKEQDIHAQQNDLMASALTAVAGDEDPMMGAISDAVSKAVTFEEITPEIGKRQGEDRLTIVSELSKGQVGSSAQDAALLKRIYQSFTRQEIGKLMEGETLGLKAGVSKEVVQQKMQSLPGADAPQNAPHHNRVSMERLSPTLQMNAPSMGR